MINSIPTAQEQLKFLKNIQLILQSGSFSSDPSQNNGQHVREELGLRGLAWVV